MTLNSVDGIAYTRGPGASLLSTPFLGGAKRASLRYGWLLECMLQRGKDPSSRNMQTLSRRASHGTFCPLMDHTNPRTLSFTYQQAHALTPLLTTPDVAFPFLTLLISGGHTLLLLARSRRSFQTLATTPDESIGNAFDKVSKMLKIGWGKLGPGAALEQFCLTGNDQQLPEIIPKLPGGQPGKLAFSYSGLHSVVERFIAARDGNLDDPTKLALARAFQTAAISQLEEKLLLGLRWCRQNGIVIRDIVVSGGVASNKLLRQR